MIAFLTACGQPVADDGNDVRANAPTEIEALPADESSVTTTEELENGANEPDVGNLGNQH